MTICKTVMARSWYANIWIGGDHHAAVQACRQFCMEGLCVTVTPTTFVYTGGVEEGVCVRLIQYPRFMKTESELVDTTRRLADFLRATLCQHSYSIETPTETWWSSTRE